MKQLNRRGILLLSTLLFSSLHSLSGCGSQTIKGKWKEIVTETTKNQIVVNPVRLNEFFKNFTVEREIKGVKVSGILDSYYFKYRAEKDSTLNYLSNLSYKYMPDYLGDTVCRKEYSSMFKKSFFEREVLGDQIDFFYKFKDIETSCFVCDKPPFEHLILFDNHSDTVYHRIREIKN